VLCLTDLTPERNFIAAERIEDETWQVSEAQEATRENGGGIDEFRTQSRPRYSLH
jgi:hypothetical protein